VSPSPEVVTDITVLHEWVDQAAFDAYLQSEAFARARCCRR
jgi:quinol monooxygenase YgiN